MRLESSLLCFLLIFFKIREFNCTASELLFSSNLLDSGEGGVPQFSQSSEDLLNDHGFAKHLEESLSFVTESTPSEIIVSSCTAFTNYYGDLAANFTQCAIRNARPLKFCEHCVDVYVNSLNVYRLIMEGSIMTTSNDRNVTCKKILLESDRVQIVVKTAHFIQGLWDECDCTNCFEYTQSGNGTITSYYPNNDTLVFLDMNEQAKNCFKNFSGDFDIYGQRSGNNTVCHDCEVEYHALSLFYDKLEEKEHREVCMDVVDAMNITRMIWSQQFQCRESYDDQVLVLTLAGVFCLLPIIFYIANMAYGARVNGQLIRQKRLRDIQSSETSSPDESLNVINT
ncbi:hypothetical protein CAPTEDRAFT_185251 [Capitella teleta]|uniref:Osteopetrosis-associated transmembrane protein 1 n=1 Tax=Capitella teleta TaxID=283909 RepID=R7T5C7_CAPTE|nr:hypothetical protein CAPTEDRAFT_185251 [Capitella teleta]|eukprot:ELT88308.1 hypothetical protein CAPTEDRAFT_185251 [Capitella teleta]